MEKIHLNNEVVPEIYIMKGYPVIQKNQSYVPIKDEKGDDVEINSLLKRLSDDLRKVLFTDLDGIYRDRPQLDLIKTIKTDKEIWFDAGTRLGSSAIDVLVSGADYVIIGTKTLRELKELKKAHELSENLILDLHYDRGIVSPNREIKDTSPSLLVQKVRDMGLKTIVFTDLQHLKVDSPFDINVGRSMIYKGLDVYFHGKSEEDVKKFSKLEIKGTIVEANNLLCCKGD